MGEPDLDRIPPHLTLVPPVNVREVDDAKRVLRAAAQATRPFELTLGPLATFLPDNPVAYLAVSGNVNALHKLRDAVFHPPLERELTWPFVPHVTVADGIEPDRIDAAVHVLTSFERHVTVASVHLLEERGRVWEPIAGFPLGPPRVIGRGGLPIEVDVLEEDRGCVVVTAYRDASPVGLALAHRDGRRVVLTELAVGEAHRRDGIGSHLLAAVESWASAAGAKAVAIDAAVPLDDTARAFLRARGWHDGEPRLERGL